MSFASLATLAVASADLHLVQDIIGAMRAADADAKAADSSPAASVATSRPQVSTIVVRHDVFEPRPNQSTSALKPVGAFSGCYQNSRKILPIQPGSMPRLALQPSATDNCEPAISNSSKSPIQAPWAVLPWQQPAKQIVQVKVVRQHTDILSKGSLIDMFI